MADRDHWLTFSPVRLARFLGGDDTKQLRLANKPNFGLTIFANVNALRPTIIANGLAIIAQGLQTALWAQIHCERGKGFKIKVLCVMAHVERSCDLSHSVAL